MRTAPFLLCIMMTSNFLLIPLFAYQVVFSHDTYRPSVHSSIHACMHTRNLPGFPFPSLLDRFRWAYRGVSRYTGWDFGVSRFVGEGEGDGEEVG